MNFLRNRAGVVIIFCIGFAIVAFLLGDVMSYGGPSWSSSQNQVGEINGKAIDYNEFNQEVEQTTEMFRQQMGGMMSPQMKVWAVDQVWNQYLNRELFEREINRIGLSVGSAELNEIVHGDAPSPQIMQAFADPQTGQFDRTQLQFFLAEVNNLPSNHEVHGQWNTLLDNVVAERLNEKFTTLINNSVYITSLEANEEYALRNKSVGFDYVLLDYDLVNDAEVTLTDADYKEYYDENRKSFYNEEELRTIQYVLFDASPTAADTARVLAESERQAAQLVETPNDSLFAAVNSHTKYPYVYRRSGSYNPQLDSLLFAAPIGAVVGPVLSNGVFEFAKVVDSKLSPDSIKASHILLNVEMEGGLAPARQKADSIKNLVQSGESFAALAIQFSIDESNKFNGGDLGTFPRGMMVSEFENPVFEGRRGEVLIVTTQFGIHVVRVDDVIGNSKVVKAAVVDKVVNSGKETIDAVYSQATQFFSSLGSGNLSEKAAEQGLIVHRADRINARESMLQGIPVKRELIRWAFDAKDTELTDKIYESEDNDFYIVARLDETHSKGQLPLNAVKSDIEDAVRNRVKAKTLVSRVSEASSGTQNLEAVAQKLGAEIASANNVVMANPVIPGIALEPKIVGALFGMEPGRLSNPLPGNQGVYLVHVAGFANPAPLVDLESQKQQMAISQVQRNWALLFQALQDNAKITDNRARFF